MSLTVEFTPVEEARIRDVAKTEGTNPNDLIKRLVDKYLPVGPSKEKEDPMLALFAQWDQEDANMTPEEIEAEKRQWEELKANINAERDRVGARRVF